MTPRKMEEICLLFCIFEAACGDSQQQRMGEATDGTEGGDKKSWEIK